MKKTGKKYFKMWNTKSSIYYYTVIFSVALFLISIKSPGLFWLSAPLLVFVLFNLILAISYPVVEDNCLGLVWPLLPKLNRWIKYEDIDSIQFKRAKSYGWHFTVTVTKTDGRSIRAWDLALLPDLAIGDLIQDLRTHGVEVDNQLRITDIS